MEFDIAVRLNPAAHITVIKDISRESTYSHLFIGNATTPSTTRRQRCAANMKNVLRRSSVIRMSLRIPLERPENMAMKVRGRIEMIRIGSMLI